MDELDIEVVGSRPKPRKRKRSSRLVGGLGRAPRALLMRPCLLMVAGCAGFVLFVGTPHAGWDYECRHPFRPGQPCRAVFYCAYYGVQGRRLVFPKPGESCQLVTLLPIDWQQVVNSISMQNLRPFY